MTAEDLALDAARIEAQLKSTLEALKVKLATLDDATTDAAGLLLSRRPELIRRVRSIAALEPSGQHIRIHGDFHLGQTLRTADAKSPDGGDDFVLIDFEGEPARPIEERRRKQSPLKDVAGMLRSFSYVAFAAVDHFVGSERGSADPDALAAWAHWWQNAASAAEPAQALLKVYLLEKALYEVFYELNSRPGWLHIPMHGILAL
jgi:maltose alpha-D-glucosyltransferase/alpha-amylase